MIREFYDKNYIIYGFSGLCGLGIVLRLILDIVYIYLVKQSDKLGTTKNKLLKHMKMKFETCYKLNIGVNNVDTFVDKSMTKYRFCGLLLSTWENLSGQVLYLNFLIIPISAVFGVIYDVDRENILYTGAVGILAGAVLIFVDKMINLPVKKQVIRLNLLDYLENFCKVRMEHELTQPEKLEQYRKDFLNAVGLKDSKADKEADKRSEKISRKEARRRKKEEKRLEALRKEEEKRKLEEARKEEERRLQEERKMLAAKRREEELRRLREEREALMRRREELIKKAEEKQRQNELRYKEKEEKEKSINDLRDDLQGLKEDMYTDDTVKAGEKPFKDDNFAAEEKQIKDSIEEIAADKEEAADKDNEKYESKLFMNMSPEEEKLIEDVLREFFA
ncbi:hypothetical protein DFR55_1375 [Herbinix hemicellulosilytica]|uniref:Putative membrane protein n=1 Tax=Herbinix hemicellulosilytica TaxID=1564487 RepID=A0A0H5SJE2_HERHM|nr:hypothetical protein [Herbinix hemicellulosilytica]RBP56823.1 hypothetical protein DFR55_1375 [Herbinix hemicellulosilytica]CRZ35627.1 putative membrane protein [Herbinix hemicellulosilytica]